MNRINVANPPEFTYDDSDPEGFRAGMVRPGPGWGAERTGSSVYELPPGQALCPYHYEQGEEEWLLVLEGRPTVRDPDGETELEPFDLLFFPPGPRGAHALRNPTSETVRVLMWSDIGFPGVTVYPDSDKVGVWDRDKSESRMLRRSPHLDYFDGEV